MLTLQICTLMLMTRSYHHSPHISQLLAVSLNFPLTSKRKSIGFGAHRRRYKKGLLVQEEYSFSFSYVLKQIGPDQAQFLTECSVMIITLLLTRVVDFGWTKFRFYSSHLLKTHVPLYLLYLGILLKVAAKKCWNFEDNL